MQKNINPFTEQELELLKSNYSKIARKRSVSHAYVRMIAIGDREVNTEKAKAILNELQTIVNAFKSLA